MRTRPTRAHLARWLPFLAWPRPDRATLRGEVVAGLTVAMFVIPQAVAYAALAGMPLVTGAATALPGLYFCGQITVPTGQLREIGIEAQRIAKAAKAYVVRAA